MGAMDVERRPHWDTELIEAVIDLQYHCVDCIEDDYPDIDPRNRDAVNAAWAYAVIAAVEDWHTAKRDSRDRTHSDDCWRWHQECAEHLIEAQQARLGELSAQLLWYPDWQRRAEKAEAQVQRVRELHHAYDAMDRRRRCGCCGHPWPCLTALAVDVDNMDGAE